MSSCLKNLKNLCVWKMFSNNENFIKYSIKINLHFKACFAPFNCGNKNTGMPSRWRRPMYVVLRASDLQGLEEVWFTSS